MGRRGQEVHGERWDLLLISGAPSLVSQVNWQSQVFWFLIEGQDGGWSVTWGRVVVVRYDVLQEPWQKRQSISISVQNYSMV